MIGWISVASLKSLFFLSYYSYIRFCVYCSDNPFPVHFNLCFVFSSVCVANIDGFYRLIVHGIAWGVSLSCFSIVQEHQSTLLTLWPHTNWAPSYYIFTHIYLHLHPLRSFSIMYFCINTKLYSLSELLPQNSLFCVSRQACLTIALFSRIFIICLICNILMKLLALWEGSHFSIRAFYRS